MPSVTERDDRLYLLAAFSVFLSVIEYMIPKPLPFLRLGLANLPILLSLGIFTPRMVLLLTLYKVIGQGLIQGTLFSYVFLFSAAGSFAGTLAMLGTYRAFKDRVSLVGVSACGAFTGNILRLFLARFILFGDRVWIVAPPFLILGLVSSILLGLFASSFVTGSRWLERTAGDGP